MKTAWNITPFLILFFSFVLISCNSSTKGAEPVWSELPGVTSLDNYNHTAFVATLENQIADNKNIIYAPAFLYAWDKVKEELKLPIILDSANSLDFKLINQSLSHQNSLADSEFTVTAQIVDGVITARAFFNKTLPFQTKLQVWDKPIRFDTVNVPAFGMQYYDEDAIEFTQILYYKNDNNLILKLTPKDFNHEIILVKGVDNYQTLKDAIRLTNDLIMLGKNEQSNTSLSWKYQIVPEDIFAIPVIKFNIASNYSKIEGQTFFAKDNKRHWVEEAYQRTGFILNENGAVVESTAVTSTDTTSVSPIITHPKKMIFDRTFLIIIKRADKSNPYFVMKVANAELLTKK